MRSQATVIFVLLVRLIIIPQSLCNEVFDASSFHKLACICSSQNLISAVVSKCATACDCSPGSTANSWTCFCYTDKDPEVTASNLSASCSTSCHCTFGSLGQVGSWKIWIFSKSTVIMLLIFGLVMTLAFIASLVWYAYRERKYLVGVTIFSPKKDANFNGSTKLMSNRALSVLEHKAYIDTPYVPALGCVRTASFLFRNKREKVLGTLERFSYSELEEATEKFSKSNLIGVGGSSSVYSGHLRCGKTVAVKRLKIRGGPDFEAVFLTEIELISRLHHFHVVPLLGYCSENRGKRAERLLVFQYMANGNLRECLDGASGKFLDWSTRVAIALGAAKGLEYLHEAAAPKILHRDVKSTNVLLDEKLRAKITDLGVAKHLRADDLPSRHSSPARMQGTFGYFAPEYATLGRASLKSDVFSFGVVLLELISGRQPISKSATKGEESLVIWATRRLLDGKRVITELPDPQLNGDFPEEEIQIMAYLAKECLLLDPDSRPSMSEAVQILSTIAPEKSARQNFSISMGQYSFNSIKSDEDVARADKHLKTEELKEVTSSEVMSHRCSLPLHIDRTLCVDKDKKEVDAFLEDIDRLLPLTTKASHLHSHEDEAVDISEPKFESFCMEHVRCSV